MKNFNFHQTTKILFGNGRIIELAEVVLLYGNKALLVTTPAAIPALQQQYSLVKKILTDKGVDVTHYDGVIPNPTVEIITAGAKMAKECGAQVIIGLGGGSSMDAAKAISVEATHPGTSWDYLFYKTPQPDEIGDVENMPFKQKNMILQKYGAVPTVVTQEEIDFWETRGLIRNEADYVR